MWNRFKEANDDPYAILKSEITEDGTFTALAGAVPFAEIDGAFGRE